MINKKMRDMMKATAVAVVVARDVVAEVVAAKVVVAKVVVAEVVALAASPGAVAEARLKLTL